MDEGRSAPLPFSVHPSFKEKQELRRQLDAKRRAACLALPHAAFDLRDKLLTHSGFSDFIETSAKAVAGYRPFRGEIDPTPCLDALKRLGHRIFLPVMKGRADPLLFRELKEGDALTANAFGIEEPVSTLEAGEPEILIVPLMGFDRQRARLGHGGGYYDRTLKDLRSRRQILAIGVAYACQEVHEIPRESHDEVLDWIVTEKEIF